MDINQLPSHQCQVKEYLCSQALMPGSFHLPCLLAHLQHSTSSLETPSFSKACGKTLVTDQAGQ